MDFYLDGAEGRTGPYDTLMIIRRIRSGRLQLTDMLYPGAREAGRPVNQVPFFKDVYDEMEREEMILPLEEERMQIFPLRMMKSAFKFVSNDSAAPLITALFFICTAVPALFAFFVMKTDLWWLVAGGFVMIALPVYAITMLRLSRMQLLTMEMVEKILMRAIGPLYVCSTIMVLLLMVILLGAYSLSPITAIAVFALLFPLWLIFTCLTIMTIADQSEGFLRALSLSYITLKQLSFKELFGLYLVSLMNIILLPFVVITFPMTFAVLSDVYDHYFHRY